jgi:hypothetical protein
VRAPDANRFILTCRPYLRIFSSATPVRQAACWPSSYLKPRSLQSNSRARCREGAQALGPACRTLGVQLLAPLTNATSPLAAAGQPLQDLPPESYGLVHSLTGQVAPLPLLHFRLRSSAARYGTPYSLFPLSFNCLTALG